MHGLVHVFNLKSGESSFGCQGLLLLSEHFPVQQMVSVGQLCILNKASNGIGLTKATLKG